MDSQEAWPAAFEFVSSALAADFDPASCVKALVSLGPECLRSSSDERPLHMWVCTTVRVHSCSLVGNTRCGLYWTVAWSLKATYFERSFEA